MIKSKIFKIFLVALIAFEVLSLFSTCMAVNPDRYKFSQIIDTSGTFFQRTTAVLGYIQYFGVIISIAGLVIIGLKYMFSSVEGKAEYKKTMIPYTIGLAMLLGVSILIGLIASVASHSKYSTGGGSSTPEANVVDPNSSGGAGW